MCIREKEKKRRRREGKIAVPRNSYGKLRPRYGGTGAARSYAILDILSGSLTVITRSDFISKDRQRQAAAGREGRDGQKGRGGQREILSVRARWQLLVEIRSTR